MPSLIQNYEAMIILNPTMVEQDREALVEKLKKILTDGGMDLKETALWGKRRLAYPIEKRTDGYYVIFYFQSEDAAAVLSKLEQTCRYDENVVRFMAVKVPTKKKGLEVAQIVPSPGWLADFRLEPRSYGPRRPRFEPRGEGPRGEAPRGDQAPGEPQAAATAVAEPETAGPAADEAGKE